jgi:hypothetical protein
MPQQQTKIIANATRSEVENMPEIQSLALRVGELSRSVDFWNQLMIWGLAVAATAAVFIVVATRIVVSRTGQLSIAQDLLREAKDRQLQLDLSQKGIELGNLNAAVDAAKTEVAKQQTRAASAEKDLLELQQRLAHRRISPDEQTKLAAKLLPYAGSIVAVTKLGESEASRFADDLLAVFTKAKWDVKLTFAGNMSPPPYGLQCLIDTRTKAGRALADVLRQFPAVDIREAHGNPPHDFIVGTIVVGLKPPA